ILVLIVGGVIWDEFFKYQFFAKRFGTVVPGEIFRSGQISVAMFEPTVKKHDIQVVIDLNGYDTTDPNQVNEVETSKRLGIEHCRFRLDGDGRGDIMQYATAIEKLVECQSTNKPVLVHCAAGAHRTGGVVACYRMLLEGVPAEAAYAEMCDYGLRGGVEGRLPVYINENIEELATELVRRGVLNEMPRELPQIGEEPIPVKEHKITEQGGYDKTQESSSTVSL
ncbi:MAG: dual specificity protein phosphatase family protein, partial [Planctomycetaceae bacterium]|nr:dual specificity protein phosphatase family protein [Planctomycetaceae bacterium]